MIAPHHLLAVFILLATAPMGALSITGCGHSCTTEYRSYSVKFARDIDVPFAQASKLTLETCVGAQAARRCETSIIVGKNVGREFSSDVLRGTFSENGTKTHFEAALSLGESSGTVPVVVTAKDTAGTVVMDVTAQVTWVDADEHGCHTKPASEQL